MPRLIHLGLCYGLLGSATLLVALGIEPVFNNILSAVLVGLMFGAFVGALLEGLSRAGHAAGWLVSFIGYSSVAMFMYVDFAAFGTIPTLIIMGLIITVWAIRERIKHGYWP